MNYELITDEDIKRLESTPYNPPSFSNTFTEDDFDDEWWLVWESLKEQLSKIARPYRDHKKLGDFALSESRGDSRWIYLTFYTPKLWRDSFCEIVTEFLCSLPNDYAVGCLTEMRKDKDALIQPLIYLAITKESVKGQAMSLDDNFDLKLDNNQLARVGFSFDL